jgi:hypothetical protein
VKDSGQSRYLLLAGKLQEDRGPGNLVLLTDFVHLDVNNIKSEMNVKSEPPGLQGN